MLITSVTAQSDKLRQVEIIGIFLPVFADNAD
jgi:hypothetical protein